MIHSVLFCPCLVDHGCRRGNEWQYRFPRFSLYLGECEVLGGRGRRVGGLPRDVCGSLGKGAARQGEEGKA